MLELFQTIIASHTKALFKCKVFKFGAIIWLLLRTSMQGNSSSKYSKIGIPSDEISICFRCVTRHSLRKVGGKITPVNSLVLICKSSKLAGKVNIWVPSSSSSSGIIFYVQLFHTINCIGIQCSTM